MSKKFVEKNIVTNEKSEKFFLKCNLNTRYNGIEQSKNKAFMPYLVQSKRRHFECMLIPSCEKGGLTQLYLAGWGNAG